MSNNKYGTKQFYEERVGEHFAKLQSVLDGHGFVLFFLAKKNAGKGTYSKILQNITDGKIIHIGVGDLVRAAEKRALDDGERAGLIEDLKKYYKGDGAVEDVVQKIVDEASDLSSLLPTEVVMALIEKAVEDNKGKAVIIDGFPRSLDQVDIALRMQSDFEQQGLPTAFVEIDCPDDVLHQRQLYRVVCPQCQTPRNLKVLVTEDVEYDEETGDFHLVCDDEKCSKVRMVKKYQVKEGESEYDIETFKKDQQSTKDILAKVRDVAAHCHLVVNNHIPVSEAESHDPEDFTLEAEFDWDPEAKKVVKNFKPWVVNDDTGEKVYSRYPDPVVADLVKELSVWLDKNKK